MRFFLPFIGKTKQSYLEEGIQDYAERIGRYGRVDLPILKEKNSKNVSDEVIKLQEAEVLLSKTQTLKRSVLVALDPAGKAVDSHQLAALLASWQDRGIDTAAFIIGGHLGLHKKVLQAADKVVSLSRLTFTHEMTRLILLEQIYRACTINAGQKYHK